MKKAHYAFSLLALSVSAAFQAQAHTATDDQKIEKVEVKGVRQRLEQAGTLANTIFKTEVVDAHSIEKMNAVNLSEAINTSPGVKISDECSMCGVKRIMLNGMKGEQTTILIDGLPMHTMMSGYYGVDAISTTGVQDIEVARGAGASLIAPEAIGGTINIISKEPTQNGASFDLSVGENGYKKAGFLGEGVSEDGHTRATVVAQYDTRDQYDGDDNHVSESPFQENRNISARVSQDFGEFDNVVLRVANVSSEVFGGPVLGDDFINGKAASIGNVISGFDANDTDAQDFFVDTDVHKAFNANAWETTEWIKTNRNEASLAWLKEWSDNLNMHVATSFAEHKQDSFYEGFDYSADDKLHFYDIRFNYNANEDNLITFGGDLRNEQMRSYSAAGLESPDFTSDAFNYDTKGLYIQDSWQASDDLEINLALRADHIKADFIDPSKPGVELDETIISPRMDMRYHHNAQWTSRISAGRGYRAPLSFFETDHGILDGNVGFNIDIDSLERSKSFNYSLSYAGDRLTSTASFAWTSVDNLATLDEDENGIPLLTQLDESGAVVTSDISTGYQLTDSVLLNLTLEHFNYDEVFKSSYAIAPIVNRITTTLDWDVNNWDIYADVTWIGHRDLTEFGYEGYDRLLDNGMADPTSVKPTDAPSYFTVNMKASYQLNSNTSLYVGASNLLDYTQVNDEDTPLFYDAEGGFDVAYIYAPLRGREAYAGIKMTF